MRRGNARPRPHRALPLLALLWLAACGFDTVRQQTFPALDEKGGVTVGKVAVVPFTPASDLARGGPENTPVTSREVTRLVTRYVSEALLQRGVEVVPADDFGEALERAGIDPHAAGSRRAVTNLAAFEFGADGVVMGEVLRFRERTGEALASASPASVGLAVSLFDAPAARRLWRGTFEETQQPINENVFNMGRYPAGGTRWLRAEELARWGAKEMARSMPVSP